MGYVRRTKGPLRVFFCIIIKCLMKLNSCSLKESGILEVNFNAAGCVPPPQINSIK